MNKIVFETVGEGINHCSNIKRERGTLVVSILMYPLIQRTDTEISNIGEECI